MTVEAQPLGVKCNLRCTYCYENPMRDNQQYQKPDYDAMIRELKKMGTNFTTFGGEPLLIPIKDLEKLWKFGHENWKQNGIQTNGSLITDRHWELFRKYNVHVGFSIDGPDKLNDARQAPSGILSATRRMTDRSCANLEAAIRVHKLNCSLIVTLHRLNASRDRLTRLIAWFRILSKLGPQDLNVRLHFLENDDASNLLLTEDELFDALMELEMLHGHGIKFDFFDEIKAQLEDGKGGCCVYQGCDPMNTQAVQAVGPKGEELNCGRTNKRGIDYLKDTRVESTRSIILQATPQEDGGCKGCEYWYACKGNCPGTGIEGDWRNRTVYCSILKRLFAHIVEKYQIKLLHHGCSNDLKPGMKLCDCCHHDSPHIDYHGDDYGDSHANVHAHSDTPHKDTPHQDKIHLPVLAVRR